MGRALLIAEFYVNIKYKVPVKKEDDQKNESK